MRRKSSINREKRLNTIEWARRIAPEQRVDVAANLSQAVSEMERAGKVQREERALKGRP